MEPTPWYKDPRSWNMVRFMIFFWHGVAAYLILRYTWGTNPIVAVAQYILPGLHKQ